MPEQYTASRIHEILCQADGLEPANEASLLNRIRYLAKMELLENGEKVDQRGMLAFPPLEVYRAAIFCELAGLAMDVRALAPVTSAAAKRHLLDMNKPPSLKIGGGWRSEGGLIDSVRGAAAAEQWWLTLEYKLRGQFSTGGLVAEFLWEGASDPDVQKAAREILGRKPTRTSARVDLSVLYAGIIPIVGVPS